MKDDNREHLLSLVQDFETAMLTTRTAEGHLRARPLAIAELDDSGSLYFAVGVDSPKVRELEGDPRVGITLQGKTKFVSLSGTGRISTDQALIDRLYKEDWKVWFPDGKEDPSLGILIVDPTDGEYWDNSGLKSVRFLLESAKAYVRGERAEHSKKDFAKVKI